MGASTRSNTRPPPILSCRQGGGHPWVTRLAFPVHVVERVETFDEVSNSRIVTRYAYHHGFYDGPEREFRGFARVDQRDTEDFASLSARKAPSLADDWDLS